MIARRFTAIASTCLALALAASAGAASTTALAPVSRPEAAANFKAANPGADFYWTGNRITTVYGRAFSAGASPVASAEAFLNQSAALFGVDAADLVPGTLATDGAAVRGFMPDLDDGHLRFTLVSYLQTKDGIPVYRSDVRVLVRNEAGFPATLARSALKDLGGFVPDAAVAASPNLAGAQAQAALQFPGIGNFTTPQVVIWAGTPDVPAAPALAVVFEGTVADVWSPDYQKQLFVADAATGAILHAESLIHTIDVTGSVKGMATPGKKADICATEVLTNLPYSRVSIGATVAYADVNGNFTIPNAGSSAVTVTSGIRGRYFLGQNAAAGNADPEVQTQNVTPPGPANFVHNQLNNNATFLSGVNAYLQANVVRDYALLYSPGYPTITNQTEPNGSVFPVNINVSGTCNAFYDGGSINFYPAGGGCPATSYGDVVHHEYGHHLVQSAGSGQGQYGEGTGDCMGVLISDEPILGYGFQGNCNAGIRTADNTKQYPQTGEIHDAGQLISGCLWSTRNALAGPYPSTYRSIISTLAINAILLHAGDTITPQITIDYMTLDDDNADISDGTPHYSQIQAGFSAHNMPGPAVAPLKFVYPSGRPSLIPPNGGVAFTVQVQSNGETPAPNTGKLFVDAENDGTYVQYAMNQTSPNTYEANFPATPCGNLVRYYVSAQSTAPTTVTNPVNAPTGYYTAISATSMNTVFNDNFQNNLGWTTSVSGATTGQWQRAVPTGQGQRGDPPSDYDGSGMCFVTQNGAPGSDTDVDGGSVLLTSPTLDATGGEAFLSYARWYSNNFGGDPNNDTFLVELSNNNGGSWTQLELVGPVNESNGGWFFKTFKLSSTLPLTSTMKVRFTARDLGSGSVVEAGVDAVKLEVASCGCPADYNGDGFVDGIDSDNFNNDFEAGNPNADFNHDGFVDGIDYDEFFNHFEAGC